jgi:Transposase DDE domain group 1
MKRFVDQTGIREYLATLDLPRGGSNRAYDPVQVIESFWLAVWTGASRYVHCEWLRQDKTLADIFGYDSLPSQSTYSRFFGKFSQARNAAVFPALQGWFFGQINTGAVTVDFDSTVITREGSQEGSAKGYNPNRRGRNSHHPLIAFVSQTRMVANAWLRPGNTAASSNCVEFMRETFDEALDGVKVGLVRADSGFYTDAILSALEERGLPYVIAAKAYSNLRNEIHGMKDWVEICPGIAVKEWTHQPSNPKIKARRHIVVRKQMSRRPQAAGKLLFEDQPDYRFSLYVTNLELPLDQIWNIYNTRADCENRIRELKQDFGLDAFCLQEFWATEASFRFIMVAYNLMSLFRHFALNSRNQATLGTLRSYCFALGAWVSQHARRRVLKISLPSQKRPWMDSIFRNIEARPPPFDYPIA